jgi:predicted nucleotidyltransferase
MLFGSVARGEATSKSDLDVAIVGRNVDVLELSRAAGSLVGRDVQVTVLHDPSIVLLNELVGEGLPLFEREEGIYADWVSRTLLQLEDDLPWYRRQRAAWLRRVAEGGL